MDFQGGTLLLDADGEPIGGYVGSDLVLDFEWRDIGLSTELVVEHFLGHGSFPTWWLDSAQYSEAGYSTHLSAHRYPSTRPEEYVRKLARHVLLDNEEAFASVAEELGADELLKEIAALLLEGDRQEAPMRIADWLSARWKRKQAAM